MSVPVGQMMAVLRHVAIQRLRGNSRYPLVLMLEPLFRCNLACAGCGKIQHPAEVLRQNLTPEACFQAVDECGAPIVAIPGGEPLLHPQIEEIIAGIVARKKYLYVCTNAIKLEEMLPRFTPSKYLAFSVHLDGLQREHDASVCRDGVHAMAIAAIKAARRAGFRVTTNSTLFADADPGRCRSFFDEVMALGVEGMMVSPGYSYEKAPDQENFLSRERSQGLFRSIFRGAGRRWRFNQSPVFLEFLKGAWDLECRPWGTPSYSLFGWQKPCYLLDDGYASSFNELMETTDWSAYGRASGNPKCQQCMAHCGYEPAAVEATFGSWQGFWRTVRLMLVGPPDPPVTVTGTASAPQPRLPRLPVIEPTPAERVA
ncbi:MAG: adenosyl-hopene transferase HpnH [Planctomycetia bacterium]|jgi:hopanoid biosynthesis associated radical SAM protein HpnH|nr:adenosyl-hopene transferase HpnH [Planctomycetia bacterium]